MDNNPSLFSESHFLSLELKSEILFILGLLSSRFEPGAFSNHFTTS